ncbi:MAG: PAS domain S-box protein, partial [Candidatus Eisenbacteria bacterium]
AVTLCILGLGALAVWGSERVSAAEHAMEQSNQHHRLLFDGSPLPSWVFNHETLRFLEVNQAALQSYGFSRAEFMAMTLADIHSPEEVPRLLESVRTGELGEAPVGIWRHRHRDGSLAQVKVTRRLMSYGDTLARLELAEDVTDRLRIEADLRSSEERFRALALSANDAILSADQAGNITYLNPAAERMFGIRPEAAIGQSLTLIMPETYRSRHLAGLSRYLATGRGEVLGKTVELAGLRQDGEEFPIELSLASWKGPTGTAFAAIIRDITARKHADDALRRYAAELDSANQELDAFAYSVSHDLRAPLRSIDGFSQALIDDCGAQLNDEGRGHLLRIRRAAQKMGDLIDDLLVLSRLSRVPMKTTDVNLTTLVHSIRDDLHQREPARVVQWSIADGMTLRGDARLLRVALENLMSNAWKYTRGAVDPHIIVGSRLEMGQTVYFVGDNGAGFDMRYVSKLFAPFQRLHTEAEFEGLGIGLATVARVIHRHGGRVWGIGEPGVGATFAFSLEVPGHKGAPA